MLRQRLGLLPAAAMMAACASPLPTVQADAAVDHASAYVAGLFSREGMSFALRLRSLDGKGDFILPMGEDTRWPTDLRDSTIAVRVAPGRYVIAEAFAYGTVGKGLITRAPDSHMLVGRRFEVGPGAVAHLGEFKTESRYLRDPRTYATRWELCIHPRASSERKMAATFRAAYPRLAAQPFSCPGCEAASAAH